MTLDQILRHHQVEAWRIPIVALLDLLHQPVEKLTGISTGPEAAPGVLVGVNPFDHLVYLSDADARETAARLIRNRILDGGIFALSEIKVADKPLATDEEILPYVDSQALRYETDTYVREHAANFPQDWLTEEVPEYDDYDLAEMSTQDVEAHKKMRAEFVERATAKGLETVAGNRLDYLRTIGRPSNREGYNLYLRMTRKYFNVDAFALRLLSTRSPETFLSRGMVPLALHDPLGNVVGVAFDYTPV